jgi:hypothetical protein
VWGRHALSWGQLYRGAAAGSAQSTCGRNLPRQVLLLDALDEADPAATAVAGPRAGAGGPGPGPGAGGGGGGPYPVLCGNPALQLLTNHLQRLPACVRFFLTTRPDAASGQVRAAVAAARRAGLRHAVGGPERAWAADAAVGLAGGRGCGRASASVARPLHDCGPPAKPRPNQATSTALT